MVDPQALLQFRPPPPPLAPQHSPNDVLINLELHPELGSENGIEDSESKLILASNGGPDEVYFVDNSLANLGNNSGAGRDIFFSGPSPGDTSITNLCMPAPGRGRGEETKSPDFAISRWNLDGRSTQGGGADTLRMVVEIIPGHDGPSSAVRLSREEQMQLLGYFLLVQVNSVDAGVMLIVKGDAYFWHYDELGTASIQLRGRYSRRIDSWDFMRFLQRWSAGEEGVRFDLPQNDLVV
ncbi:hypothetical protein V565_043810 [Rhizoctonia solani 123E]|uniref:Uncharacterized protein n=1 Tax=Rhizoctonia solani 123E TaxID=1423351 RepID=A0A074RZT5_9AGAM|nr:hypothetical protein V565_043810 [Rhizoctonia solani 123E]